MVTDVQEIKEALQEAIDKVYEAVDALERAKRMMKDLPYGYNIAGNMEGYVINYLTAGTDSIAEKIEKYLEETEELGDEDDDVDDEDESEEQIDSTPDETEEN